MARPRYVTEACRQREVDVVHAVLDRLSGDFGVTHLPDTHDADFLAVHEGGAEYLIEVKTRTCRSTRYPTYHVSLDKLLRLQKRGRDEGRRVLLFVSWQDAYGAINVDKFLHYATVTQSGRWDRHDPHDVESMANVSIAHFKLFRKA